MSKILDGFVKTYYFALQENKSIKLIYSKIWLFNNKPSILGFHIQA